MRLLGRRDRVDEHEIEQRVGLVAAEDVGGDPVRHAQRPGEERPVRLLHLQERRRDERAAGLEALPSGGARRLDATETEGQADADAPAGHVVVEVAVVALEAVVDVGRHRREQDVEIERVEAAAGGEGAHPELGATGAGSVGLLLDRGRLLGGHGTVDPDPVVAQQLVDPLVAEVEPEERVVR